MRVTYDYATNAAYIYLVDIPPGGVRHTVSCEEATEKGEILLDFDADWKLLGIEVLLARAVLPEEVLYNADERQ